MPAPYGLTPTGLSRPTIEELRAIINQRVWANLFPTLDLSDRSFEGQLIGILCDALIQLWELGEASVFGTIDPDQAVNAALDAVCLLTGTTRRGAYASTVVLTLTGDPGTSVPANSGARVPDGAQFETSGPAVTTALAVWAPTTFYDVGARVTANGNAYVCSTAGVSASGSGPVGTGTNIADGAAVWRYLGEGTAAIDVGAHAIATGPLHANSGTLTEITTPVGGWKGVINLLDAEPGADQMSDASLRVLRELELARPGHGSVDAIEADLLEVPGVTAATAFHNNTDHTDADGIPPHSVEAMVQGGEDQAIWDALLASVVAGIRTHGNVVGTATDRRGREHVIAFTRPTDIPIYIELAVTKDPNEYPSDGDDQITEAIVAWGDAQRTGKDAVPSAIEAQAFRIRGVLDVTAFVGTAPGPATRTTVPIALRELATYDTSRINVTSTDGTP